jgi:site-specific DNA-methyltransferase (adenine-specific)
MKIESKTVKLTQIKPNPDNPRTITGTGMDRLVKSLQEFPEMLNIREIVVDESMMVLGGNMRLAALKKSGADECTAKIVTGLSPEQKRRFIISDNGSFGDWNYDELANKWDDLPLAEWGVEIPEDWGAKEPEGDADAEPQIDRAEELNKIWQVKTGDLFQIGEHRLLCGDSTKAEDVERVVGGERAVLFATDPPYGVAYNDETGSGKGDKIINDENDGPKLQRFLESCFTAWLPSLNKNAAWYLWHAQLTQGFFAAAAAAAGLLIHRQIIWVKPSLIMGHGDYHWKHELCFYGWQQGNRPPFYGERNQDTVWNIGRESDGIHPTQKPTALWDAPLHNHTKDGEICAEPFAGSGSQFVACQNLNRKCRGIEISPDYCAVILERMKTAFPGIEIRRIEP